MIHVEFLVEEPSAEAALAILVHKLLSPSMSFRIHAHRGKLDLLRKLSARLRAYRKMDWQDLAIVVLMR